MLQLQKPQKPQNINLLFKPLILRPMILKSHFSYKSNENNKKYKYLGVTFLGLSSCYILKNIIDKNIESKHIDSLFEHGLITNTNKEQYIGILKACNEYILNNNYVYTLVNDKYLIVMKKTNETIIDYDTKKTRNYNTQTNTGNGFEIIKFIDMYKPNYPISFKIIIDNKLNIKYKIGEITKVDIKMRNLDDATGIQNIKYITEIMDYNLAYNSEQLKQNGIPYYYNIVNAIGKQDRKTFENIFGPYSGSWKYYDYDGLLIKSEELSLGNLIKVTHYSKNGGIKIDIYMYGKLFGSCENGEYTEDDA
jgi:hypothetical protein